MTRSRAPDATSRSRAASASAREGDSTWYREVLEEKDPERQLRLNARNGAAAKSRMGHIFGVIRSGASSDPEVAALWMPVLAPVLAEFLAGKGEHAPGAQPAVAAATAQ